MIARMVFQMAMMVVVVALAVHMIVQRSHARSQQVAVAAKIAQPVPQISSLVEIQPQPKAVGAAVVAQIKPAATVSTKDDVASGKPARSIQNASSTMEVASLPGTGEVVR